jgi:hypothetical protein
LHHEVNWGASNTLADQWWTPSPPTAILKVANANAQMVVTSVLLGLGYKPSEDYVFGADVGADRFYTGSYQVGPIEWAMQKLRRRRPAVYLIGVRVKERDRGDMERLAEWTPRVNTAKDALTLVIQVTSRDDLRAVC